MRAVSEGIVKLVVTTTNLSTETGQRLQISLQLQNQAGLAEQPTSGQVLKLVATSNASTGTFFNRSNSSTPQAEFDQTTANRSIYYQDMVAGTPTLNFTVSDGGLTQSLKASTQVAVVAPVEPGGDTTPPVVVTPLRFADGAAIENAIIRGSKTIVATQEEANPKNLTIAYQQKNQLDAWQTLASTRSDTNRAELAIDTAATPDGMRRVLVTSEDQAGNVAEKNVTLTTDNTVPAGLNATVGGEGLAGARLRGMVTLAFAQSETNPASLTARYQQSVDNVWQTRAETTVGGTRGNLDVDTKKWANGNYRLLLLASDTAGNTASQEIGFTIDNPSPLPPLALGALRYDATNGQLVGTVNDATAVISVEIGGVTYPARVLPTPSADGTFAWIVDVSALPASLLLYQATVTATQGGRDASDTLAFRVVDTGSVSVQTIDTSRQLATIQPINSGAVLAGRATSQPSTILNPAVLSSDMGATQGISDVTDLTPMTITASPGDSRAVVEASSSGWKLFGLAWYWWLVIVAVIGAIVWFFWPRLMKFGKNKGA